MGALALVIGNKNYSSWSLRPWLALKAAGADFTEIRIALRQPQTKEQILRYSPSGHLPALLDGNLTIWDSLAICEYLAERFPAAGLWPETATVRAQARSVAAEMHSGFAALRNDLPMDIRGRLSRPLSPEAEVDIQRVQAIWRACREGFGAGGPFLFGRFGIADAMFAPVATRFRSYGVTLDPVSAAYVDAIFGWPAMQEWVAAAQAESEVLDQ